ERACAVLGNVRLDEPGAHGLHWVAKGGKPGKGALPPHAYPALDQSLAPRQLPVSRERWNPKTPLVGSLGEYGNAGITGPHLWCVLRRVFTQAAEASEAVHPVAAETQRRATPHCMRHSQASPALARGA
ncbi:integrase, partial [Klebsiella pneumoniae subsp. pneumoniae]